MVPDDAQLLRLIRAIVAEDQDGAASVLAASAELATARIEGGATRQAAVQWFLDEIRAAKSHK